MSEGSMSATSATLLSRYEISFFWSESMTL